MPGLNPEQARALAREILQRPEYLSHRGAPSFLQQWVDSLAAWLRGLADWTPPQWLIDLWQGFWSGSSELLGTTFGNSAVVVLLRLALALAVLGALAILAHRALRELRARRAPAEAPGVVAPGAGPRLIDDAEGLAREGRFLEAAHCIHLASLQLLLRKSWLELERSDPNRTLRRRLAEATLPDRVRDRFLLLLDRLESHWFRDRAEDHELYSDWRALHARIETLPDAG